MSTITSDWIKNVFSVITLVDFNQEKQCFDDVSEQILVVLLRIDCILFTCAFPLWWGGVSTSLSYVIFTVILWLISLYGTRRVQMYGFLAFVYLASLVNLLSSLHSTYLVMFMLFVILASIAKGYKSAIIATVLVLLTYVVFVFLGKIESGPIIGPALITVLVAVFMSLMVQSIKNALEKQVALTDSLKKTSDKLSETLGELHVALSREREINQIQSDLLNAVSYEFFTPMSVIKMSSKMVMRKHERGQLSIEDSQSYYSEIEGNVGRLTELVNIMINNKPQTNDELNALVEQIKSEIWAT